MDTVTTRIPEEDAELLKQIEEEEHAPRSEVLRRLIERGLDDWRREKALKLLQDHQITLRKAAEIAGVSYVEMLELSSEHGIQTGYTEDDLDRDLEQI
jgi:predicted HTH domain antitoxin